MKGLKLIFMGLLSLVLGGCASIAGSVKYSDTTQVMRVTQVVNCMNRPDLLKRLNKTRSAQNAVTPEQCQVNMFYILTSKPAKLWKEFTILIYLDTFAFESRGDLAYPGDLVEVKIAPYSGPLAGQNKIGKKVCDADDKVCVDSTDLNTVSP